MTIFPRAPTEAMIAAAIRAGINRNAAIAAWCAMFDAAQIEQVKADEVNEKPDGSVLYVRV